MKNILVPVLVCSVIAATFFGFSACNGNKTNADSNKDGIIVEMPDGSRVRIHGKKQLEKWGMTKKQIERIPEHRVLVKRCFKIPTQALPTEFQKAYPESRFMAIDAMFATQPRPLDPDEVSVKDMDGERVLAELIGRVHLNPETGEAIKEMSGDVVPEYLRELLVFRLKDTFDKALLYVEMKPRAEVHIGPQPAKLPNLEVMIKPMPPEDSKIKPPQTEPDKLLNQPPMHEHNHRN